MACDMTKQETELCQQWALAHHRKSKPSCPEDCEWQDGQCLELMALVMFAIDVFKSREFDAQVERIAAGREVREALWLGHGCALAGLYGDDGEMQCSSGRHRPLDFKNENVGVILRVLQEASYRKGFSDAFTATRDGFNAECAWDDAFDPDDVGRMKHVDRPDVEAMPTLRAYRESMLAYYLGDTNDASTAGSGKTDTLD